MAKKKKKKKGAKKKGSNRAKEAAKREKEKGPVLPTRTEVVVVGAANDAERDLLQQVTDQPMLGAMWKGEIKGDSITGVFVGRETVTGDYGPQEQLEIITADGETAFYIPAHHVKTVDKLNLKDGDVIAIQYKGQGKSNKKGNYANLYAFASSSSSK